MIKKIRHIFNYVVLIGLAILALLPFLWMISTSFKGNEQIFAYPPEWIPKIWRWQNYVDIWSQLPFLAYFRNSVFISLFTILGTLLSSSLVAYAFAVLRWPGRDKLFIFILVTMMLPLQVTMIPVFVMFKNLGWLNTFKPLIVPAFLGGGAFNIFLLRQFFLRVPRELIDAARIDGCSEWRIYWEIMLPMAKPALATVAIMTFMFTWNDFLGPLIYLSDKLKGTLALGVVMFVGQHSTEWGQLMAISIIMMLPVIIIFFLFQRFFIKGFIMTGIKG